MNPPAAAPDLVLMVQDSVPNASSQLVQALTRSVRDALAGPLRISPELRAVDGMSGLRYRQLLNQLISELPEPRYLEIGSFKGSTLCSAIEGNAVQATVIDNWSEFGGPAGEFYANLSRFKGPRARVSVIERDFREVDYRTIGRFNVFMFDGPHLEIDHYDALMLAAPALDDAFILIIDDWNLAPVRSGTRRALSQLKLYVDTWIEIRTTLDDTHPAVSWQNSDWHDGYLCAVLRKDSRT